MENQKPSWYFLTRLIKSKLEWLQKPDLEIFQKFEEFCGNFEGMIVVLTKNSGPISFLTKILA